MAAYTFIVSIHYLESAIKENLSLQWFIFYMTEENYRIGLILSTIFLISNAFVANAITVLIAQINELIYILQVKILIINKYCKMRSIKCYSTLRMNESTCIGYPSISILTFLKIIFKILTINKLFVPLLK